MISRIVNIVRAIVDVTEKDLILGSSFNLRPTSHWRRTRLAIVILVNTPDQRDDDEVERLRVIWKRGAAAERRHAEIRIRGILEAAALREWQLLQAARAGFLDLDIKKPALAELVGESRKRVSKALETGFWWPSSAHTLASRLEEYENAASTKKSTLVVEDGTPRAAEALEAEPEIVFTRPEQLVPVNATCPVTGKAIDPAILVARGSDVIRFCCSNCAVRYWEDPDAFPLKN